MSMRPNEFQPDHDRERVGRGTTPRRLPGSLAASAGHCGGSGLPVHPLLAPARFGDAGRDPGTCPGAAGARLRRHRAHVAPAAGGPGRRRLRPGDRPALQYLSHRHPPGGGLAGGAGAPDHDRVRCRRGAPDRAQHGRPRRPRRGTGPRAGRPGPDRRHAGHPASRLAVRALRARSVRPADAPGIGASCARWRPAAIPDRPAGSTSRAKGTGWSPPGRRRRRPRWSGSGTRRATARSPVTRTSSPGSSTN